MARPERFERPTPWFVAKYSIQLSYGRGSRIIVNSAGQDNLRLALYFIAPHEGRTPTLPDLLQPRRLSQCSNIVLGKKTLELPEALNVFDDQRRMLGCGGEDLF